jgi:hypothetical protein
MWNFLRKPKRRGHVDHATIRESARLERTRADARLLLAAYFRQGSLARRRVKTMGGRRWTAAYRLLKLAGVLDPINGHPRTRSYDRAVLVLDQAAASYRRRLEESKDRYTLPF